MVAVLAQPLRQHAQRAANRLVYGRTGEPYEALRGLARQLTGAISAEEVLPRIAEAVARGVGATHSRVRVFLPDGAEQSATWPPDAHSPSSSPTTADVAEAIGSDDAASAEGSDSTDGPAGSGVIEHVVPVRYQATLVGEIAAGKIAGQEVTASEEHLLVELAAQAGHTLHNLRLTAELNALIREQQRQAEALRTSQARLVAAEDGARQRLERDIHDGAQQHLVALAVRLGLARQLLKRDPAQATALLDELGGQANEALSTLRELARGVFPPLLADKGVVAALRAHTARLRAPVRFDVPPALESERFLPAIEAGMYFCCLEALQNAAKHAPGADVTIRLGEIDEWLAFIVEDSGPGFGADLPANTIAHERENGVLHNSIAHGSGVQSMRDRLEALGGTLSIRTGPRGTAVVGTVPARRPDKPASKSLDAIAEALGDAAISNPNPARPALSPHAGVVP